MGTRFTLADSSDEIAFGTDRDAFRAFWATLIHFATADKASEIRYRLESQEECLTLVVDGKVHAMNPPPPEFRCALLTMLRRLAGDSLRQAWLTWLSALDRRTRLLGTLTFETRDDIVTWQVYSNASGATMYRNK